MLRYLVPGLVVSAAFAAPKAYELSGRILPKARASISLLGATTPYSGTTFLFPGGEFHFKKLQPGEYTLVIFIRGRGEARRTIEIAPASADRRGRISMNVSLKDSDFVLAPALERHTVSSKELSIPSAAWRDYRDAQKDLEKHDVEAAVKRLERAVDRAPQFSAAWNNLGTIAYQSKQYARAEECFRQALAQDPQSYEALVNLGGVLLTLHKMDEALGRNALAAETRPNDALAQSQLGMTYFLLGKLDLARNHLERAREIDPAHFSYPQLVLAEIDFRQGNARAAADALDDFLAHHPGWPDADGVRRKIGELRSH